MTTTKKPWRKSPLSIAIDKPHGACIYWKQRILPGHSLHLFFQSPILSLAGIRQEVFTTREHFNESERSPMLDKYWFHNHGKTRRMEGVAGMWPAGQLVVGAALRSQF